MRIDLLAGEPQFLDHTAPVWRALDPSLRGEARVAAALVSRAAARGMDATPLDVASLRRSVAPPGPIPGPGPAAFVASIGDLKLGRRLGYRRFAYIEHGIGQAYIGDHASAGHPSYSGGTEHEDVELFLVPNAYAANLWRDAYPGACTVIIGSPRLEDLPGREPGPAPTVALSFHWPGFVSPESATALGHYLRILPELAREFRVIGHGHPKGDWPEQMQRHYRRAGIEWVAEFDEVCRRADVYVADNSSTLYEFAAIGRPVVVLNSPQYRRSVHHGLRFWLAADVGIQVDDPEDLVAAIGRALEDPPEVRARREEALRTVYAYRTGASERAAAAIADWAAVGQLEGVA